MAAGCFRLSLTGGGRRADGRAWQCGRFPVHRAGLSVLAASASSGVGPRAHASSTRGLRCAGSVCATVGVKGSCELECVEGPLCLVVGGVDGPAALVVTLGQVRGIPWLNVAWKFGGFK